MQDVALITRKLGLAETKKTKKPVVVEHVHYDKDGNPGIFEVHGYPIFDSAGNVNQMIEYSLDITERKEAEEALKKSEAKYQNLIENANNAIISTNKEGIIISFNIRAEEMFGYSRDEILGKSILLLSPQRDRGREEKVLEMLKNTDKLDIIETTREGKGLRKDGQEFPLEASVFSLEVHEEYIITSIIRNITERKKMEKQLLQSEKLRSLGELAGGVAHDFNNVLAAIIGRAQLLKMYMESPPGVQEKRKSAHEFKKGLEIIEKAAFDGAETIKRIQEFARKRKDDKQFSIVDINELINHALEFTQVKWKDEAESKGIKINIQKEFTPIPTTRGSATELREVFTNLINNAVDAMSEGGNVTIKTSKEDGYISIKLGDTGCGIPKSIQNKIFDSFFTTKGEQSTGLGMSVSHGIISRHQGTIKIDSVVGQGTTFTIMLPISENTAGKEENIETRPKDQMRGRILIVEDEEEVRNVLSAILTHAGHEVEVVSDGNQGIEAFKEKEFDLAFTDLGMPGMSGWQVAKKMKDINGRVPVAVITGWDMQLDESELKSKWIDFMIKKPFEVEQILNLVQEGMVLRDRFKEA